MRAVLGTDAAWTPTNPSGVALVVENQDGWQLAALAPSCQRFHALADSRVPEEPLTGSCFDARLLLASAAVICGHAVELVAVDMPLARLPITGRRVSDRRVSQAYGGRGAATHSPSSLRPGDLSDNLRADFGEAGYHLCTDILAIPGLIEVYPHPALIELTRAARRLCYKFGKRRSYWKLETESTRRRHLLSVWEDIEMQLAGEIAGIEGHLHRPELERASNQEWKSYEDMLDAIVCAWVAICALQGRVAAFGDQDSAIWIPTSTSGGPSLPMEVKERRPVEG